MQRSSLRILGIDPGLTKLGYGLIVARSRQVEFLASGLICTKSTESIHKRLYTISSGIEALIRQHEPNAFAMEEIFVNMNPNSSLKLGYVRGAIMSALGQFNAPYYQYKPNLIKKTISGYGHAEKSQIVYMVKKLISGVSEKITYDEADGLAVAYTCFAHNA